MAKIVENTSGRRMIRLSAEDIVQVVQFYVKQTRSLVSSHRAAPQETKPKRVTASHASQPTHKHLNQQLQQQPLYLPEDI